MLSYKKTQIFLVIFSLTFLLTGCSVKPQIELNSNLEQVVKESEIVDITATDIGSDGLITEEIDSDLYFDKDGDYLLGHEEINLYNTDPNNPDTDGDGYLDGEEVIKGFNPNGEGKLR